MKIAVELQDFLEKIDSKIELAKTIDDKPPSNYAFYKPEKERSFRVNFGKTLHEYSVIYFKIQEKNEFCCLRGIFNSMERIAISIKNWVEDEKTSNEIANRFSELESFEYDDYENPNSKIEKRWVSIKNFVFNDRWFWENRNWEQKYFKMIRMAKGIEEWKDFYPFTSHYMLRFSLNEKNSYTWKLGLNIIPTRDEAKGKYLVNIPEEKNNKCYFNNLEKAIEFYGIKLKEYLPIKWK